ncbi:tetratricopeptide repeat protein [Amycolatopsis sp. cg5]|uniref:serine/threonine-protein kinase n=1 Tax=Amycolatopsis sp. cg5 TaxID=3238802 RepID=UPI0035234B3A
MTAEPTGTTRGAEPAQLPSVTVADPGGRLLSDPDYPEKHRHCGNPACRRPVGRGYAGQPGLMEGFCGVCEFPFSFVPKLCAGDRVADRYDVVGWLARGGLGWVYLAKDSHLDDRYVALKGVINPNDPRLPRLARVERDALIRLDHPNIVRIGNFVTDARGAEYIVMDYVGGLTLAEIIEHPAELRAEHVCSYGKQILAALDHLHANGLLYCDLKPDNVMHSGTQVKVIDLGATREIGDRDSDPIGTPGFQVGPDEIDKRGLTVRSDIHTVGRTLIALLGAVEHEQDSLTRLLARAVTAYEQRFPDAAAMAEQLGGVEREIRSLLDGIPRPSPSVWFEDTAELMDAGLGAVPGLDKWTSAARPGLDPGLPAPAQGAARLPIPRFDPADPAATFLGTVTAGDPKRLLSKLDTFPAPSVEIELRRVRAWVELPDSADAAAEALGRAEALLGLAVYHDWRIQWHHGLLALLRGRPSDAWRAFDRVYSILPGESAPKLALGFCDEHLPRFAKEAEWYYRAVWRRDPAQASAAFGLARLALRDGEYRAAIDILDKVPAVSRHHDAAHIAGVRILAAREDDLAVAEAVARLPVLYLDGGDETGEFRDRLTTIVREAVLRRVRANGHVPGFDEPGIRRQLEKSFRKLAGRARDLREHGILVDLANENRPRSLQ